MKDPINRLFDLLIFHPDDPVIPLVDEDVVTGEYSSYVGKIHDCCVAKVFMGKERLFQYEDNSMEEVLRDYLGDDEYEKLTLRGQLSAYTSIPWKEAILIQITPPDLDPLK